MNQSLLSRRVVETPEFIQRQEARKRAVMARSGNPSTGRSARPQQAQQAQQPVSNVFNLRQVAANSYAAPVAVLGSRPGATGATAATGATGATVLPTATTTTTTTQVLSEKEKAALDSIENIEKALQQTTLELNGVKDAQNALKVQSAETRNHVGQLLRKPTPEVEPAPPPPVWATAIVGQTVFKAVDSKEAVATGAELEAGERVLLQYPAKEGKSGNLWVQCHRLFEEGHLVAGWVLFFNKATLTPRFSGFSFTSST